MSIGLDKERLSALDLILVTRWNLQLGIPDRWFVLGDEAFFEVISRFKMLPMLVLCTRLCPFGVEGTIFALLMAVYNLAVTTSGYWGAALCSALGVGSDDGATGRCRLSVLLNSCQPPFGIVPLEPPTILPSLR